MKIRTGFVSNSSSSSFVLVTTKEKHEAAMKKLTPKQKKIIEELGFNEKSFLGHEIVSFETWSGMGGNGTFDEFESYDKAYEAWEKYQELIGNDDTMFFSIDF